MFFFSNKIKIMMKNMMNKLKIVIQLKFCKKTMWLALSIRELLLCQKAFCAFCLFYERTSYS